MHEVKEDQFNGTACFKMGRFDKSRLSVKRPDIYQKTFVKHIQKFPGRMSAVLRDKLIHDHFQDDIEKVSLARKIYLY